MKKEQIAGYLFEICILKLVLQSGYKAIDDNDINPNKRIIRRKRFVEIRGRGEKHQIDIPVDLEYRPSFVYPIRLFGEVKYHNKPIDKDIIRQEIGKMKDIQENYFVNKVLTRKMRAERRTELFAIFSASGFDDAAERLAYAHGIRTISYNENACIKPIIEFVESLSSIIKNYSPSSQSWLINLFFDVLILGKSLTSFPGNISDIIFDFIESLEFKTSIIGTTSTGLSIHFLSKDQFPDYLFTESDSALCRVQSQNSGSEWYLTIGDSGSKLFFTLPEIIKTEYFEKGNDRFYPKKGVELDSIFFNRIIDGKQRMLEFKFDHGWFSNISYNE